MVFLGPNGIGPWQNEEMRIALEESVSKQTIRIVPVLLPRALRPVQESNLPRFLRRLTWIVFQQHWNEEDALHRLVCGINRITPGRDAKKTEAGICPYRGLEVFREQDQNFFFGREAVVQRLLDKLKKSRFLAVLGPSGSGKSSVVQAGLIPHLRYNSLVILFTPQEQPIEELAFALRKCYLENRMPPVEQLIKRLKESEKNLHYISREILENADKKNLVIVIDQFEELFTQTRNEEERQQFIFTVLHAVEVSKSPAKIILTIRSDFIGKCAFYPDLNTYVSDNFLQVEPMSEEELQSAIEEPARQVRLHLEEGLVNRILKDVKGAPGELPLLEHALLELYEGRKGAQMTSKAYDEIGGIEGALVKRAESEYAKHDKQQKEIIRKMFVLRMIQSGEGTEDTRRKATKDELLAIGGNSQIAEDVLNHWINARLITVTQDPIRQKDLVEVAHEALIRKWDRIQAWMTEHREEARQMGILRQAALEWQQAEYKTDYLFQGERLVQMETLLKSHAKELTKTEIEFVNASIELRERKEREKEEARLKRIRQRNIIIGILAFAAIVLLIFVIVAVQQKNRADIQYKEAKSNGLAAQSMLVLPKDNINAIRIAEAAYRIGMPHPSPSAQRTLSAAAYSSFERPFYTASMQHENKVTFANFSPDGKKIFTITMKGTAKLWNLKGILLDDLNQHKDDVSIAVFSPDGTKILTASRDNTAKLWDLYGNLLADLNLHRAQISSSTFSPDGTKILTVSWDNTAKLWDLRGNLLADLNKHMNYVSSAVFSPDGTQILTASWDNTAKLWDLNGNLLKNYPHMDYVWSAVFSPDGTKILTASSDHSAKLWDLRGDLLKNFVHTNKVWSAIFSPDGSKILSRSGNTAKLWNLKGNLLANFNHANEVRDTIFSPDGSKILTRSGISAKLWNLKGMLLVDFKHTEDVSSAVFSPDGKIILTCSGNSVKRWDLDSNFVADLIQFRDEVNNAAISFDGNKLITWQGKKARIYDLRDKSSIDLTNSNPILNAAFSPDGQKILTLSLYLVRLWNQNGKHLRDLKYVDILNKAVFSYDGNSIITIFFDFTVKLWDLESNFIDNLNQNMTNVDSAILSPNGNLVLTWFGNSAMLRDVSGNHLALLNQHSNNILDAIFSNDSKKIVTASSDNTAKLWDLKGNLLTDLKKHTDSVTGAVFSSDGTEILTISDDNTAKLWDLKGNLLADLNKHTDDVLSAAFTPDGKRIITVSKDGTVKSWYTPKAIIQWLKTAPIPKLTKEDKEDLGIAEFDID
ncbi:MAG: hypothetical protein JSV88_00055 [Candidatus Aminicenantes bacterium]|nr:MAG: hypothetical protein JSV88_00055 [Candidatus Aminicenantes bacterium]